MPSTSVSFAINTSALDQKFARREFATVVKLTSMSQPRHTLLVETLLSGVVQSLLYDAVAACSVNQ